jgi:glycosidase
LRGTPFVFEGQEIGMTNFDYTSMAQIQDVESHNIDRLAKSLGFSRRMRWHKPGVGHVEGAAAVDRSPRHPVDGPTGDGAQ